MRSLGAYPLGVTTIPHVVPGQADPTAGAEDRPPRRKLHGGHRRHRTEAVGAQMKPSRAQNMRDNAAGEAIQACRPQAGKGECIPREQAEPGDPPNAIGQGLPGTREAKLSKPDAGDLLRGGGGQGLEPHFSIKRLHPSPATLRTGGFLPPSWEPFQVPDSWLSQTSVNSWRPKPAGLAPKRCIS